MAMLEIKDLEVYYGMIQAIKGISFEVNEGEVIALIGANGAGKTTTLHTITGLLPSKGDPAFGGLRGGRRTVCDHGGIPLCPGEPYFHLRLFAADLLDDARFLHFRAGAGRLEFSRIWNYLSDGNFHVCI